MYTVIGMFDALTAADQAAEQLARRGVDRDRIHLKAGEPLATVDTGQARTPDNQADAVLASVGGFFANLVESHAEDRTHTDALLQQGATVLLVDARSEAERDAALQVFREAGALDAGARGQASR